jgi:hypothetical protein
MKEFVLKSLNIYSVILFLIICFFSVIARFVSLEESPPGLFVDEASCTAHAVCLKEFGMNCNKEKWPVYSVTWGHGRVGPVFQYLSVGWMSIFGSKINSFRLMTATSGIITLLLMSLFAYFVGNRHIAFGVLLSGLLSPWLFHSSRVVWDPALGPMMAMLTVYLFFQSKNNKLRFLYILLASLSCVLTFHTYSPVGAQMFFLFLMLFISQYWTGKFKFSSWFVFGLISTLLFLTIYWIDVTAVMGRAETVSIFGDHPQNPTAGQSYDKRIIQFVLNILAHFDYEYLFTEGEFNLRHTVHSFGVMSWVDAVGITLAAVLFIINFIFKKFRLKDDEHVKYRAVLTIGIIGFLSGAIGAGLTWDSIPHGLRSLGGAPFLCLFAGTCLAYVTRFIVIRPIIMSFALYFAFVFYSYYFTQFKIDSAWWFDNDVDIELKKAIVNKDRAGWDKFMKERGYPAQAKRYFDIVYFGAREEVLN